MSVRCLTSDVVLQLLWSDLDGSQELLSLLCLDG